MISLIKTLGAILVLLCSFLSPSVFAEEDAPIIPPLEISPTTRRVSLNSEEKKAGTLQLKNYGNEALTIKVYPTPYSNEDDNRNYKKETSYTKLSHWITIKDSSGTYHESATFKLEPKQTKTIEYQITAPKDAPPGGQYASIFAETLLDKESSNDLKTATRVGLIIYATISGDIIRDLSIENIKTNSFITSDKLGIKYTVENKGNIDFQTSTSIKVSSVFGSQLYADSIVSTILPESTKEIEFKWEDTPSFGFYIFNYKIRALDEVIEKTSFVIVASPFLLIIIVFILIFTILAIVYHFRLHSTRSSKEK